MKKRARDEGHVEEEEVEQPARQRRRYGEEEEIGLLRNDERPPLTPSVLSKDETSGDYLLFYHNIRGTHIHMTLLAGVVPMSFDDWFGEVMLLQHNETYHVTYQHALLGDSKYPLINMYPRMQADASTFYGMNTTLKFHTYITPPSALRDELQEDEGIRLFDPFLLRELLLTAKDEDRSEVLKHRIFLHNGTMRLMFGSAEVVIHRWFPSRSNFRLQDIILLLTQILFSYEEEVDEATNITIMIDFTSHSAARSVTTVVFDDLSQATLRDFLDRIRILRLVPRYDLDRVKFWATTYRDLFALLLKTLEEKLNTFVKEESGSLFISTNFEEEQQQDIGTTPSLQFYDFKEVYSIREFQIQFKKSIN